MPHLMSRGVLFVLVAFLAVTTIGGALFVVPGLPMEWIDGGPFPDYTLPAVAGAVAVATGAAMAAFELVEIAVVGFSLAEYGVGEPVAWLQVVYLVIGLMTIGAGGALWAASADDRRRHGRTSRQAPSRSL